MVTDCLQKCNCHSLHPREYLYPDSQIWGAESDIRTVVVCVRIWLRSEVQSLMSVPDVRSAADPQQILPSVAVCYGSDVRLCALIAEPDPATNLMSDWRQMVIRVLIKRREYVNMFTEK